MNEKLTQVDLQCGKRQMTTWLPANPSLVVGAQVKMKDVEGWWDIKAVYATLFKSLVKKGKFDNNNYDKHVGLGL